MRALSVRVGIGLALILTWLASGSQHVQAAGGVVGTGAGTCNAPALQSAIRTIGGSGVAGTITFDCGPSATLRIPDITIRGGWDVTLDGGVGRITLDGGGANRLFSIKNGASLTLKHLTLTGGFSTGNGGAIKNSGVLTIDGSVLAGNAARHDGGAIYGMAPSIINSTVTGNSAARNGGAVWQATHSEGKIVGSTVVGNTAGGAGGGIFFAGKGRGSSADWQGAVLWGNKATPGTANCSGEANNWYNASVTFSLLGPESCGVPAGGDPTSSWGVGHHFAGNILDQDPMLGPLADNGGPTMTMAPLPGSPLIGAASSCGSGTDQRGYARAGRCDIGAAEHNGLPPGNLGTIINEKPNNLTNVATGTFTFSAKQDSSTFQCSADGGSFSACRSPYTLDYTASSDGTHTFAVRAIDLAGNVDPTPATYTWTIDRAAPTTTATLPPLPAGDAWNTSAPVMVKLSATDASPGAGVKEIVYSAHGAESMSGANMSGGTTSLPITAEGMTTVNFHAVDGAGNVETDRSITVKIDRTPPTVAGTPDRAPDHNGWYTHPLTVSWRGSDALSGDAGCSAPATYGGADGATASVTGTCTDVAGNTGPGTYTFKYDASPPLVSYSAHPNTYTVDQVVNIQCGASDTASGVDMPSDTCVPIWGPAYTFAIGANSYHAEAYDNAGNKGAGTTSFNVIVTTTSLGNLAVAFSSNCTVTNGLRDILTAIQKGMDSSDSTAVGGEIAEFKTQVQAERGKGFTTTQADILLALINNLK